MVIHAVGDNARDSWSLTDHNSWKKFHSNENAHKPYIHLEYDHVPLLSNVELNDDGSCGAGLGLRKYLTMDDTNLKFTARIKDDDKSPLPSFNVRLEVKATPVGGGTVLTGTSQNLAPNGSAIEVRLSQPLDNTKVYRYQLRGMDLYGDGTPMEYTDWSSPCELGFDNATLVSPPVVSGLTAELVDDDGDGLPETPYHILNYGTPAQLTFSPGAGDAGKVAAYRYGFSQLFVRAVTILGGHASTKVIDVYHLAEEIPEVTHVRGDLNGDGAGDHAGYKALSDEEGMFYSYFGRNDGTLSSPAQLMKAGYGSGNSKVAQGDFSGDGKTDFAVFYANGANDLLLKALTSDGTGLRDVEVWSSALAGTANLGRWSLAAMRIMAGDVNADGMDDLVVAYPNGTTNWMFKVFTATVVSGQLRFQDPVNWLAAPIQYNLNLAKLVIGQFDNQPGLDVAAFQDLGSCRTVLTIHESPPTGQFHAGHVVWDSANPAATWCLDNSQFITGEYGNTGTGIEGILAVYDHGSCLSTVVTFTIEYIGGVQRWFPNISQWTLGGFPLTGTWCASAIDVSLRSLWGGAREGLVLSYRCCGPYQQRVWLFRPEGPAVEVIVRKPTVTYVGGRNIFQTPATGAQGSLGPVGVGSVKIDPTVRYQLVAKHSNKCGYQTAVCQEGNSWCAFYLRLAADGKWHLELLNNINAGNDFVMSSAISATPAVAGSWVHLVGVYDKAANQGRLYVNESPDGVTSVPGGVSASGPLVIGAAWSGSVREGRLAGGVNDVRAWERVLSDSEVAQLYAAGAS